MSDPLWQPTETVQLSAHELMDLVDDHLLRARNAAASGQGEVQQFHVNRAAELRERVASVAPHLLAPDGTSIV